MTLDEAGIPCAEPGATPLSEALSRAADAGPAEAELRRQSALRRAGAEAKLARATRALFIDALYRAKALNGDGAFDLDDVDDLDSLEDMAARIGARRRARPGDAP